MEELRIKCPSCGIILDVRNSKNEAVKRIVCPNCKKHLAVTFHEEPKPAQFVDIRMVKLSDGSTKTIVRALTDEHVVKVNGEQLQKDDEVVLMVGDQLQIDDVEGVLGQEGHVNYRQVVAQDNALQQSQEPQHSPNPIPPASSYNHKTYYLLFIVAACVFALIIWKYSANSKEPVVAQVEQTDTLVTPSTEHDAEITKKQSEKIQSRSSNRDQNQKTHEKEPSTDANLAGLSNYELERLAINGHVEAQYLLGKRWIGRHDSINVVKGIKYLKLAANNGSSEARNTLQAVFDALQRSAANGSSTAANILREQR